MISTFSRLTGGSTAEVSASLFAEMLGGARGKKISIVDVRVPISHTMRLKLHKPIKGGVSIKLSDASKQISMQNPADEDLSTIKEKTKKKYRKKVSKKKTKITALRTPLKLH